MAFAAEFEGAYTQNEFLAGEVGGLTDGLLVTTTVPDGAVAEVARGYVVGVRGR